MSVECPRNHLIRAITIVVEASATRMCVGCLRSHLNRAVEVAVDLTSMELGALTEKEVAGSQS